MGHAMCLSVFDDKRVITSVIAIWTMATSAVFLVIMLQDESPFLSFGPNQRTKLMGVSLDTWEKWWCVAVYTFVSTGIAAFASDAVVPWITNTIQDHKTEYIPYSKFTCLAIIQTFTVYAVIMSVIGMFVALTQIDFMLIRIAADLLVNNYTTYWFLRGKTTDSERYRQWLRQQAVGEGGGDRYPADESVCGEKGASMQLLTTPDKSCQAECLEKECLEKEECLQILTTSVPRSDVIGEETGSLANPKEKV
jgi:hypothetical protein